MVAVAAAPLALLAAVASLTATVTSLAAARSALGALVAAAIVVLVAVRARLLLEQGLPVGKRDLIVVRMDFGKGQEAVPVAAIFDESGLQRRFDPGDLREVDVAA